MSNIPLHIVFPIGGKGERFAQEGWTEPKPLIHVFGKPMIFHVTDRLKLQNSDQISFICHQSLVGHGFEEIVRRHWEEKGLKGTLHFTVLQEQTRGAAESVLRGLRQVFDSEGLVSLPLLLLDCDTFYTHDVVGDFRDRCTWMHANKREDRGGSVFYRWLETGSEEALAEEIKAKYSYIKMPVGTFEIQAIAEKEMISHYANTGAYGFFSAEEFLRGAEAICESGLFQREPYISYVIKYLLEQEEAPFFGEEVCGTMVFSLGTPAELSRYLKKSKVLCMDLDGTCVNSDHIYYKVWTKILSDYNITLNREIYTKYIQGKSDMNVFHHLLPGVSVQIHEVSARKDSLFLEMVGEVEKISGIEQHVKNAWERGYPICIVTNCNRGIAERILEACGLEKWIDFVVVGAECPRAKPYPDPYLEAIRQYEIDGEGLERVMIYEDSKTGLLSATSVKPGCVVGIASIYSPEELRVLGANVAIEHYTGVWVDDLWKRGTSSMEDKFRELEGYIIDSLAYSMKVAKVHFDTIKLKGGYISDVLALTLVLEDGERKDCVLKLESKAVSKLSQMALELGLYEREYYFYENIVKYAGIKTPYFYGLVKDQEMQNVGILMENLYKKGFMMGMNLAGAGVETSLTIIDRFARMHARFWGKDLGRAFPELKKHNDVMFRPKWKTFIDAGFEAFVDRWKYVLTEGQLERAEGIRGRFMEIQESLSTGEHLTLCHGDIKSPNIFYEKRGDGTWEPYFIDWQYIAIGKGVQDLVFFMIESFDVPQMRLYAPIFKNYYYAKLMEYGVEGYSVEEYQRDFENASCYFPYFVAIWFGTTPQDDLIDKNFSFFFIQKLFAFYDMM